MQISSMAPPTEVLDAIERAFRSVDRLAACGRHVHFELTASGGVTVTLQDLNSAEIKELRPSEALVLAAGGSVGEDHGGMTLSAAPPGQPPERPHAPGGVTRS